MGKRISESVSQHIMTTFSLNHNSSPFKKYNLHVLMGNNQRQSFPILPPSPEVDLVLPKNVFCIEKCNLLIPNEIGIKTTIVTSEQEREIGFWRIGD